MTANPYRYKHDPQKRIAYENACDCLYYGVSSNQWCRNGLDKAEAAEVWQQAFYDMTDGADRW